MASLLDFIAQRRAEIKKEMAGLRAELAKLKAAEDAFNSGGTVHAPTAPDGVVAGSKMTIKEMIIDVMAEAPQGADARQIIDMIAKKYSVIIQRPSISPQLSRLKDDGLLELEGTIWKPATGAPKTKASDVASEAFKAGGVTGLSGGTSDKGRPQVGPTPTTSTSQLRRKMLSGTASPELKLPPFKGGVGL